MNKSAIFKHAWSSLKFFVTNGKVVTFAQMLKRAWSFAKAALKPMVLNLKGWGD